MISSIVQLGYLDVTNCKIFGGSGETLGLSQSEALKQFLAGLCGIAAPEALFSSQDPPFSHLESISMHMNDIVQIECFSPSRFPVLKRLVLDGNQITSLPMQVRLLGPFLLLKEEKASDKRHWQVAEMIGLSALFLSCNRLTACPTEICTLPDLEVTPLRYHSCLSLQC